jgi:hypothetical protein
MQRRLRQTYATKRNAGPRRVCAAELTCNPLALSLASPLTRFPEAYFRCFRLLR